MSTLTTLHGRLHALRAQRRGARWLRGLTMLALAALSSLAAVFLVDWLFFLNRLERVVAMGLALVAIVYLFRRYVLPWLTRHEDEVDVALLVQRGQRIDSDIVAALQFESPVGRYGGSTALAKAVVDRAADLSDNVDWQQTERETAHHRPLQALVAAVAMLVVLGLIFPGHVQVFLNRMGLGSRHYPANTFISEVWVGKSSISIGNDRAPPVRSPFGQPVTFQVRASGTLPERGEVRLTTLDGAAPTSVELRPLADQLGVFEGQLPRLVEDVRFEVFVGDDWTEPYTLAAIPLPIVTLSVKAEPPPYARAAADDRASDGGPRQIAVVEGSRVSIEIECRNKELREATLTIAGQAFAMKPNDTRKRVWRLPPEGTVFEHVTDGVRYTLEVVDIDGLSLAEPIEGYVRIKTDRPPRVTAAVVTQHVLPTGKPRIAFGAIDDFGIAGLRLLCLVAREDGSTVEHTVEVPIENAPQPLVQGRYPLDLAQLKLNRGDQVRITLEARDYRGDNLGKTAVSEAVVLQVTDERGVLAAMTETDQRTARQMDLIIQRQLGLGEGP